MSHRLGSLLTPAAPFVVGPDSGLSATAPNRWERAFSPPDAPGGTKFLMLHLSVTNLTGGDRVEVDLGYGTDVFTAASGPSFWARPVKGNSVTLRYIDDGGGGGSVTVVEYGRGEGLKLGGADGVAGGNTNADVFLIDSPYVEPTFFNASGICPGGMTPSWESAACLPAGLMRDTARSVGMFVLAHGADVTSCSAALIGPDLILTAGHCLMSQADVDSASFTLDYQTNCDGTRPAGYNPTFYKVTKLVKTGFARGPGDTRPTLDYSIAQLDVGGGVGVPPLAMRTSVPAIGDELFVIHHPRGTTKKVSRKPADPTCQVITNAGSVLSYACDSDNGSSGSPILDLMGRIVAVNDWAPGSCNNSGQAASAIIQDFLDPVPPTRDIDVMLVLDRSGSMSLAGLSGASKMAEAKQAAALFLDLIRTDRAHRAGVVSFSDTVTLDSGLVAATPASVTTLIGPAPARNAGIVGALSAGGWTSIGGGLDRARQQFPPSPATNAPAIVLMTDGLQNTPPMIADVEGALGSVRVCIVGFGTEASLDGPLLSRVARDHAGLYTRAGEGLSLKKFFVLCFGNIFQSGISLDPLFTLDAGATSAAPIALGVCGEDSITVVVGWQRPGAGLILTLTTPGGLTVTPATPGVVASGGDTWTYLRISLPLNGERDGTWTILVSRQGRGGGEFLPALEAERFFVSTVVDGGPVMRPPAIRRYYTGDTINPLVSLRYPDGEDVDATMTVEVEVPGDSTGNLLARSGLQAGAEFGGDQLDARTSTLLALEQAQGHPLIATALQTFPLFDDETHEEGALEPDGVYGNPLKGLTRHEGHYTFRARAEFGEGCRTARETAWSVYVAVGIDPAQTDVTTAQVGTHSDGRPIIRVTVTPKDRYGNFLGPGRLGDFTVHGVPGSQPVGPMTDAGDGSYVQDVAWDHAVSSAPGIVLTQPGRPPVVAGPSGPAAGGTRQNCLVWTLVGLAFVLLVALIWALTR